MKMSSQDQIAHLEAVRQEEARERAHEARFPEHAKLRLIAEEAQANGRFIDWLHENKMTICVREGRHYEAIQKSIPELLATYHDIDVRKLNEEKDAMLNEQRALNAERE